MKTQPHWHAGNNDSGYLPESTPSCFSTFEEAKQYMIGELKFSDEYADSENEAEELCSEAEDLNLDNGPEWESTIAGRVYWIMLTDENCEDGDEES